MKKMLESVWNVEIFQDMKVVGQCYVNSMR